MVANYLARTLGIISLILNYLIEDKTVRVNSRVFDERTDMFDRIQVPNCPSEFRAIAENILMMATKPGYSVGDYHTMTELDKNLMVDYWVAFDGLGHLGVSFASLADFTIWFTKKATAPELIRRARQFLVEKNYLIIKPEVQKHAYEASSKFSRSVKQG